MIRIKIYECAICKRLVDNHVKGEVGFKGTRKDVRKHLHDVHKLKHVKNTKGVNKKDFGQSSITKNTIAVEFK
jgi:hypothetical protein